MPTADELRLHHLKGLFESQDENVHEEIYDFFPGIIYVYDAHTKKLSYVNKKITDVLGFSAHDILNWDNDFTKVIFKDDVELVQKELEKFNKLKDEESHSYHCRFNRKAGDWMHFQVMGKILRRDQDGEVASLLLVARDIHEQIRSEQELDVMRELAEDNEELLQFGNWNWNPDTDLLNWSRGMYILMDFNPDEYAPEMTMDFYQRHIVARDQEPIKAAFDSARSKKEKTVEFKHTVITNLQKEKIFFSKGKVIYNNRGEIKNIVGITHDITESTRMVDNLANYKRMVMDREDFLGHGSWEWNLVEKTSVWSDGMYRLFGYDSAMDKSQVTVNEDLYRLHLPPDAFEKARAHLKDILRKGDGNYLWSYEIKGRNGEIKWAESFGKIIRDSTGRGLKVVGTTRDVTQLRKYADDLERKNSELDRLSKELEDSAYAASHDLQEPLRKISTLSDRLEDKFNEILPEDGKKYLGRIKVATKNARLLIDSLLEFSRITHEGEAFRKTDLNSLLKEVKADLELKIEETHTTIHFGKLPTVEASPLLIKQLFSNILLNSIKFRKADTLPVIDIQGRILEKPEIQNLHLDSGIPYFLITIQDNGIGFEEVYATKIFQMFSRLHGKSEYPGAGIGLAHCKKIVANHKGHIFASSAPEQGATFSVILPGKHI
jgi:PAS domain S-box-containing protein